MFDNLEANGWQVFAMHKRVNERITLKGSWLTICNRNLNDCIHVSIPISLRVGHLCNLETCQSRRVIRAENLCKFSFL